jgi:hypothetical protein
MPAAIATIEKRLLKKLVKCAKHSVAAPVNFRDHDVVEEFDADNAAIEWVESLAYSITSIRLIMRDTKSLSFLDSRGVSCIVEPVKAIRRLVTIAKRAGFEGSEIVCEAIFTSLPIGYALPAARNSKRWAYSVTLVAQNRFGRTALGTVTVMAENQAAAQHRAHTKLWNPRKNGGVPRYSLVRLTSEESLEFEKNEIENQHINQPFVDEVHAF